MSHLKPREVYYAISTIVLFQSALESYINFMIYDNKQKLQASNMNANRLIESPIKHKWLEFPKIIAGRTYDENAQPFLDFRELVDLRNKLIHFKTKKMNIEIQLPKERMTVGELRDFIGQPGALSGHILMDIMPVAIAGRTITDGMIRSLHDMIEIEPPGFLKGDQHILALKILSE
jgi:hypothetical protein